MKLQILINDEWKYVFCHKDGKVITTQHKNKALPPHSRWANDDLKFFSSKFGNDQFRLTKG